MKFKNLVLILSIFLLGSITYASVIQVSEGTGVLSAAISSAADGDVIELISDGGIYAESAKFPSISKSISIVAAEGLVHKPVIRTPEADYMFKLTGKNAAYVFKGLEIDGTNGTGTALAKYFLRIDNADSTGKMFVSVRDCYLHDFADKFIKPYANSGIDELIVDNSVFSGGATEGIVLYSGTSSDPAVHLRKASITNSTFYKIEREAIKGQTFDSTLVLIDRCTFYDCGNVEAKSILYFRNMEDVEVKNSIFANNHNPDAGEEFADFASSVSLFHHNVAWDIVNIEVGSATVSDTLRADPQFADASNGNFTIGNTTLLTFADDGGSVGDPRWVPEPTVIQIAAGTDVLSAAIASVEDGGTIELTTSGGIYSESAQISSISKNITIRAAEGLANKPIIRVNTTDYILKLTGVNSRYVFKGLEIDGSNGTGSSVSKYFLRIDNLDPAGNMEVIVDDCVIHHFTDKFIKPYGNTGMDSLVVRNSILYNGGSEGIVFYSGSSGDPAAIIAYGEVSNTTMYNITRECIKGDTYTDGKIVIDHLTAYNCGGGTKGMIYFDDWLDVTVKNSIFVKNTFASNFARFESDANIVKNCVIWDVASYKTEGTTSVTDTLHVDPQFADAPNGDFTIGNPILFTFADDGSPVGDPRWVSLEGKYTLNVIIEGSGQVILDPPGRIYDAGTVVKLTAVADSYWKFTGWSDNISVFPPNNPVAQVTMNQNMEVTAYFEPTINKYEVTVSSIGLGHVEIEEYSIFELPGYYEGDSLVLKPIADTTSWEFAYWVNTAGDSIGNANPLSYIVHADTAFTALFRSKLPQVSLTVNISGLGSVLIDPQPVEGFDTYDQGTEITLVAEPELGWEFQDWSGGITGTEATVVLTLNSDMTITATFIEKAVPNGELIVDNTWDIRDALEFAKNNTQVDLIKIVSIGPFMPSESERREGRLPQLDIDFPVTIVGADTLSTRPVIKGWGEGGSEGLFRLRKNGHLVLKNLEIDGDFATGKTTKYIFRLDDGDSIDVSLKADNVNFHGTGECFLKFYALAHADTIRLTNCTVWNIGKEGIFDNACGTSDYIELKNSTFHHINREILRLKTQNPKVIIDHVTVDSCGFGYGVEGAKFAAFKVEVPNEISITNSIVSNVPNSVYGYSVRFSGEKSYMNNVLLYNTPKIDVSGGSVLGQDIYWYDPMFAYATRYDYTLKDSSVAYHLAGDGSVSIGDLKWATSTNIATYYMLDIVTGGHGKVSVTPAPMAKFYIPSTMVTLTAIPDTLYKMGEWSGDATGTESLIQITMNSNKTIQVSFLKAYYLVTMNVNMSYWTYLGKFSIENDSVDVAGNFNNWGEKSIWMSDENADSIYTADIKIDENYPDIQWKFRINGSWDNATCEFPFGGPNRSYTVICDTVLTYWYNDQQFPSDGLLSELIPDHYELNQNYPNPFNPVTTIKFALKQDGFTTLTVYDMLGREVARLVNQEMRAGYHQVVFSDIGKLASGVYIYKLTSGNFNSVKKMMLMK